MRQTLMVCILECLAHNPSEAIVRAWGHACTGWQGHIQGGRDMTLSGIKQRRGGLSHAPHLSCMHHLNNRSD